MRVLRFVAVGILTYTDVARAASYYLTTNCGSQNFFECFGFYTGSDPTNGFVQYLNQSAATSAKLIRPSPSQLYLGVDTSHVLPTNGPGRASIRLESRDTFTHGLFVLNVSHMPQGCGPWPAFWSFGPSWPSNGEIDVLETVNGGVQNLMSLHTSTNCTIAGSDQSGTLLTNNCDVGYSTTGCGVQSSSQSSAGVGANRVGGGVYAMEWTSSSIRVWNFAPAAVPASLHSNTPNPDQFGKPVANFQGSCNIDKHFANHKMVIDTIFCGDFAGNVYGSSGCPLTKGQTGPQSCVSYVARNPQAFTQAYWMINGLKVYQMASSSASSMATKTSSMSLSSVKPVASTVSISSISLAMGSSSVKVATTSRLDAVGFAKPESGSTSSLELTLGASHSGVESSPTEMRLPTSASKPTTTSMSPNSSSFTKSASLSISAESTPTLLSSSGAGSTTSTSASNISGKLNSTSSYSSKTSSHTGLITHTLLEVASRMRLVQSPSPDSDSAAFTAGKVRARQVQVPPSSGGCVSTLLGYETDFISPSTDIPIRTVTTSVGVTASNCPESDPCPSCD